jgi:hypothetical protein
MCLTSLNIFPIFSICNCITCLGKQNMLTIRRHMQNIKYLSIVNFVNNCLITEDDGRIYNTNLLIIVL